MVAYKLAILQAKYKGNELSAGFVDAKVAILCIWAKYFNSATL